MSINLNNYLSLFKSSSYLLGKIVKDIWIQFFNKEKKQEETNHSVSFSFVHRRRIMKIIKCVPSVLCSNLNDHNVVTY